MAGRHVQVGVIDVKAITNDAVADVMKQQAANDNKTKVRNKDYVINFGKGLKRDYKDVFDDIQKTIDKRQKDIQKQLKDFKPEVNIDLSGINIKDSQKDKINNAVKEAIRKNNDLDVSALKKQLTDYYKLETRKKEIDDSSNKVLSTLSDNGYSIKGAKEQIRLLNEEYKVKKKMLDLSAEINKILPKDHRIGDVNAGEVREAKEKTQNAPQQFLDLMTNDIVNKRKELDKSFRSYKKEAKALFDETGTIAKPFEFPDYKSLFDQAENAANNVIRKSHEEISVERGKVQKITNVSGEEVSIKTSTIDHIKTANKYLEIYGDTADRVTESLTALFYKHQDQSDIIDMVRQYKEAKDSLTEEEKAESPSSQWIEKYKADMADLEKELGLLDVKIDEVFAKTETWKAENNTQTFDFESDELSKLLFGNGANGEIETVKHMARAMALLNRMTGENYDQLHDKELISEDELREIENVIQKYSELGLSSGFEGKMENSVGRAFREVGETLTQVEKAAEKAKLPLEDIQKITSYDSSGVTPYTQLIDSLNTLTEQSPTLQIEERTEEVKEFTKAQSEQTAKEKEAAQDDTGSNKTEDLKQETAATKELTKAKEELKKVEASVGASDKSKELIQLDREKEVNDELNEIRKRQAKTPVVSGHAMESPSSNTSHDTDIKSEIQSAKQLSNTVEDITKAVNEKTRAFQNERDIATSALNEETTSAKLLSEQLSTIQNSVESISAVKGSTKNPFEKLDEGINGLDIERLEKLASVSDRLSLALKDLNIGKIVAAGKTGIMSEADMSAESAARIAKLNAEILKTKTSTTELDAKAIAAEEKAYLEMERHEKARIEREKAALALEEQKRKIEASISAEKEKQRQDSVRANEEAKAKETEVALQKELLYLDARQEEYERLRAQYLNDGQKQAEVIVSTIKKQEQAYSDMWKQAENSYNKVWSAQQQGYKNKNKGGETGFFASDPSNLAILEKEMRALANATSGVVPDTIQFNQATKKLSFQTQDAVGNVDKYTISLNNLSNELLQTKTKTIQAVPGMEKFFGYIGTSAKKVASYIFSFGSAYKLWDELKKGISIIKEIDDSMTELKKVSDETATTYTKFQSQAAEAGRKVAQSTSDMIQASADWKKMGYSLQDSLALASASSLYVNVGDNIDITEATSDLISTMKAFNVGADDAISIVDRLNAVSNNFAVTSKDLGDILKHSSSSLAAANTSMDKTIAMGAAMNEVLQDSSIAGSTLKVLSMRLRGAKVELEEAGESTEGMANSTSKLRGQIKALTNVDGTGGFDIMKDDNTFKDIYEQMDGIAEKWKQMDDISRAGLLEKIAGKNRAQGVSALLNNWSEAEAILKTSLESSGSAMKENETYMNSISGKVNQLKAQYQEFWQASINDDMIKFFLELSTSVTKFATDIGGLVPLVLGLGAAFAGIKFAGKTFRYRDNECALLINAA